MRRGHGMVMAVMVMVMAMLACSIEWEGVRTPSPSMTKTPAWTPSMTVTFEPRHCLLVHALPGGEGSLNLRAGAGTSYPVLVVLHDGQELVMDGQAGEWFAVTAVMDGVSMTGYVHSSYVEDCP